MENNKLILSTNNTNKVEEIKDILKDLPIEVLSKKDIDMGNLEVVEDGDTLEANSEKKAKILSSKIEYMVMADDSGLFVDSLNGEPGVYSSRYGGEEGNDKKNNEKLLNEMKDVSIERRTAKFKTVIALIKDREETIFIRGECKGYIGLKPEGDKGFGYDPLFIPEGYDKTFAQLDNDVKNKISHRAKALEKIKDVLTDLIKDD
ncbi:MAG TPA: XTP/dITP diphosphatase [Tissierellaceae bacterium]|nr:XTP/dITP diphosphatase [Tissierellaceae bacterium]